MTATNDTGVQQDPTGNDRQRASQEAAKYRRKLRDTETQRDDLRDILHRTRQAVIADAVEAAGLTHKMWEASAHDISALVGDDGLLDKAKLTEAITATATDFGLNRTDRRMEPNPQQGTSNGGGAPAAKTWGKALRGE